jgi:hypothetical protein
LSKIVSHFVAHLSVFISIRSGFDKNGSRQKKKQMAGSLVLDPLVPANIILTRDSTIHRRSINPLLAKSAIGTKTFWTYLKSVRGEWMCDNIQGGKMEVEWIRTALTD